MFQFTIHINTETNEDFTDDFLTACPIPVALNGMPLYSAEEWTKIWTIGMLEKHRLRGAQLKAARKILPNPDIVTAT